MISCSIVIDLKYLALCEFSQGLDTLLDNWIYYTL